MVLHIGGTGAGPKSAKLVFDEQLADERFTKAVWC